MSGSNPSVPNDLAPNLEQNPEERISDDEPMTGAQAYYLKTLAEEAREPRTFAENLTKAEAFRRIDALREKLGM